MRKFLTKYLSPFLAVTLFLVLSSGCARRAHLSANIENYQYSPSTGNVEVHILVKNDGERNIGTYRVQYGVTYNSFPHNSWISGLNLNAGESRTEYGITSIGTGKTVSDVAVTDIKWEAQ